MYLFKNVFVTYFLGTICVLPLYCVALCESLKDNYMDRKYRKQNNMHVNGFVCLCSSVRVCACARVDARVSVMRIKGARLGVKLPFN